MEHDQRLGGRHPRRLKRQQSRRTGHGSPHAATWQRPRPCPPPTRPGTRTRLTKCLLQQLACGHIPNADDRVPMLLAVSDNGPQMTSSRTAQFMAIARIAQHFGRPGTPNDQAWIESFFGHLKGEHPYLDTLTDPAALRRKPAATA
jgi:hypothetical protein